MSEITNTQKNEAILQVLLGGNPTAIEEQESRGQTEFVNSEVLPVRILYDSKETLEGYGIKFGEPLEDDPIFCNAELPEGWKKRATEHSMWSELIDPDGNVKALIFYKAAFYDRHAHIQATLEEQVTDKEQ